MRVMRVAIWPLILLLALPLVQASDVAREQRIAEQIEDAILVGDSVRLDANGGEFLAIHTEAESPRRGSVLLLHGMGAHPDWPDIIYPLRSELPAMGWETLSIQLPIAAADAGYGAYAPLFGEARERIDAGLVWLRERGSGPVFLLAHSLGSAMAVDYLAHSPGDEVVGGLVAIGLSANPAKPGSGTLAALAGLRVPVLDLYGSEDMAGVRNSADARRKAAAANPAFSQRQVDGADHFFQGRDTALVALVNEWLRQAAR